MFTDHLYYVTINKAYYALSCSNTYTFHNCKEEQNQYNVNTVKADSLFNSLWFLLSLIARKQYI